MRLAAVGNFQQQRSVGLCEIFRANGDKVSGEFNFAVLQVHCVAQINDALVVRIRYRHGKVDASRDALVGSGVAEAFAIENISSRGDFDANYARIDRATLQRAEQ